MITSSQESVGDRHLQTSRLGRAPVTFVIISRRHLPPPAGGRSTLYPLGWERMPPDEFAQFLYAEDHERDAAQVYAVVPAQGRGVEHGLQYRHFGDEHEQHDLGHDADVDGSVGEQTTVREPPRGLSATIGMFVEFLPPLDWY